MAIGAAIVAMAVGATVVAPAISAMAPAPVGRDDAAVRRDCGPYDGGSRGRSSDKCERADTDHYKDYFAHGGAPFRDSFCTALSHGPQEETRGTHQTGVTTLIGRIGLRNQGLSLEPNRTLSVIDLLRLTTVRGS